MYCFWMVRLCNDWLRSTDGVASMDVGRAVVTSRTEKRRSQSSLAREHEDLSMLVTVGP